MPVNGIELKEGQIWEDNIGIRRTIKRNPSGSVDFPWIGENTEGGGYNPITNDGRFNGVDYSYYDLYKLIYNHESEEKTADKKEEVKEEPRYTVEEVFYAIKEHCGKYDSPLGCEFEIKNLLKRFDEDPEYKEYLRLKAIYE